MRRVFIVMLIVLHSIVPLAVATADTNPPLARSVELDVIGLNKLTIHQSELIEVLFTLHNTGDLDDTYTFELVSEVNGLEATGLPHSKFVESGYLRQVKFNLTADVDAAFETYNVSLNFTSENDPSWFQIEEFQTQVSPYSNLNFGVTGVSSFIATPDTRTAVAMNITNNATLEDNVTYNLYSQTEWNWGWTMNSTQGVNAYETLQPGSLSYVFIWIDVPPIIDGAPQSYTGPRFQLKAVSSIDGAISQWSFDLLMNVFHNVTIDDAADDLLLRPGGNDRIPISVRNNGNSQNYINMELQAISKDGLPIEGVLTDDRIATNGWTIALFGGLEGNILQPNESRTVEIGFQSPLEYSGEIDIRLRVYANGALVRMQTIDVGASIDWQRNGTVQLLTNSCQDLLPNASCDARVSLENTGNAVDSYEFILTQVPDFVNAELLVSTTEVGPNGLVEKEILNITANSSASAFEMGDVVIEVRLLNTETLVGIARVPVKIAPVIKWVFLDVIEELDSSGRLSIAMTVRNEGNTADGLLVQLQSSHATDMTFLPPSNAIYEEDVEFPRSFEVSGIQVGSNFTVRAWVELPTDQPTNGTVWVNTTIRSQFEPSTEFVYTCKGDYKGITWQVDEIEESFDLSAAFSTGFQIFKAWFLMICAVIFSGVVIFKSIVSRNQRNLEQRQREEMYRKKDTEATGDWMAKFSETTQEVAEDTSVKVRSEDFKEDFQKRAGAYKETSELVNPALTQAATTVLQSHSSNELRTSADSLLDQIQTGKVSTPHIGHTLLQSPTNQPLEQKSTSTQSVPLQTDDDFDI